MILSNLFKHTRNSAVVYEDVDLQVPSFSIGSDLSSIKENQMKVSAVYSCVNVISNSISKMPFFVVDSKTNQHQDKEQIYKLLSTQPNDCMTTSVYHKLIETRRLLNGNAYVYLERDASGVIRQLIPINSNDVAIKVINGVVVYDITINRTVYKLFYNELLHFKGYTNDGIKGISVLEFAKTAIKTGMLQEKYQESFYTRGDRPSGTLETLTDLSSKAPTADGKSLKDLMREEWQKAHSGANNAFKIAILDNGLKYSPTAQMSQKDAEFVESKEVSLADITRFFGVPLYKINAGKQSYSSNEQNSIGYIVDTLSPILNQYEQEYTIKTISKQLVDKGYCVKGNLNAELRGDIVARSAWYKAMREIGVYSVNDIRGYEDLSNVDGGDTRNASLNYVPLEDFAELSKNRNQGVNKNG